MTLERLAFWFGWLELGFVLASAGVLQHRWFLVWSGSACLALMAPHVLARVSDGRAARPKTAPGKVER